MHVAQETAQQAGLVATHTAAEEAKTTITATNEAARLATAVVTNKAIVASTIVSIGAIAAVGNAAMGVLGAVLVAVVGFLLALAAAVSSIPLVGQGLAGALIVGATTALILGGTAIIAGTAAINAAAAAAGTAATAALATPFAHGGIVTGPTLGMLGEGGKTETVLPFDIRDLDGVASGEQHFYNVLDGRVVSHLVLRHQPRVAWLHGMG